MSDETGTTVELVDAEGFVETGPTPLDAPLLSSELAETLLRRLPPGLVEPTIRFSYHAEFLTFSWELAPAVIAQLAGLGARVEFCVNHDEPDPDEFEIANTGVELRVFTNRDPDLLTSQLGRSPTHVARIGEPLGTGKARTANYWRTGREDSGFPELDELWRDFLDGLPANTAAICGPNACLGTVLTVVYGVGGFSLEAATIQRFAELGLPIGCWLYPA